MEKAIVITGSIGKSLDEVIQCIESVKTQTIPTKHLIVVDGKEHIKDIQFIIDRYEHDIDYCVLPYNTGKNGFYAHRIMAGFAHLHDHEYVLFLDADNWYEKKHVESLISDIESNDLHFSYSFRKIYDKEGNYICKDLCESLGDFPIWGNPNNGYLVDTSSYCFKSDFFKRVSQYWNHGWGADRRFFSIMKELETLNGKFKSSNLFTLCYRLGGNENSVKAEFFIEGNKIMRDKGLIYRGLT